MQAASSVTQQFQLSLPFALTSVSPGLAALHSSRARILHPSEPLLSDTCCAKCGTSLVYGSGEVRSMRLKKGGKAVDFGVGAHSTRKFLRRVCSVCGHREDVLVQGSGPSFPLPRRRQSAPTGHYDHPAQNDAAIRTTLGTTPSIPERRSPSFPVHALPPLIAPSRLSSHEPISTLSVSTRPKAKPKKSGLQALLARNREKQEQEKLRNEKGLSTFLQGLQ